MSQNYVFCLLGQEIEVADTRHQRMSSSVMGDVNHINMMNEMIENFDAFD